MRPVAWALIAALALAPTSSAFAWGAQGHQRVGGVADALLAEHAPQVAKRVRAILGFDLATAAVWADCIRSVSKTATGFHYKRTKFTPKACDTFDTPTERARMEDYARRNWTNCGKAEECHAEYHFADVGIQRDGYDRKYQGTSDYDVVHAIRAAILVLQGKKAPAPFSIKDKKEALLLLAHFVGDIHQPLHVGAIYLDAQGRMIDPDSTPGDDADAFTRGGNWLLTSKTDETENLHHDWDTVPDNFSGSESPKILELAQAVTPTKGPVSDWSIAWASESIVTSRAALSDMRFTLTKPNRWSVTFSNKAEYSDKRVRTQKDQVAKAGARLAAVLMKVFPYR